MLTCAGMPEMVSVLHSILSVKWMKHHTSSIGLLEHIRSPLAMTTLEAFIRRPAQNQISMLVITHTLSMTEGLVYSTGVPFKALI